MSNRITTSNDVVGSSATFATLTAAYTGNQTAAVNVLNCDKITLDVFYIPGVANQYAEVLVEQSNKDTAPTADADFSIFPALIASVGENQTYDNPYVIPGDKVSATTTTERMGILLTDVATRWLRVSIREKTNAGGTPTTFGTCHVRMSKTESN